MRNVLDFGARSDMHFNSTQAFQAAVDACGETGGVVYVPFGSYMLATVRLRSHVHFVLEPGAKLYGSLDPDDFDAREDIPYKLYQDGSHSYFHRSMFWAENCEDISFSGNASIDMREVWEKELVPGEGSWTGKRAVKIFAFKECRDLVFDGLTLLHATDVALYIAGCENVKVTRLTIDTNIDGISPDCCKNVVISDCVIRSGDDSIVLKSSYALNRKQVCENITVTNCTVTSRCNAIKLGTESNGGFRNIVITGCAIYDTYYAGISVETTDGGDVDGVIVSNIAMRNVGCPLFVILSDRARGPEPCPIGSMKNVLIDNITAVGPYTAFVAPQLSHLAVKDDVVMPEISACTVTGQTYKRIENITLSNILLTVPGGGTEEDRRAVLPELPRAYPQSDCFGDKYPVSGIYFRHIDELTLRNVRVRTLAPDARDPLGYDDVTTLRIL